MAFIHILCLVRRDQHQTDTEILFVDICTNNCGGGGDGCYLIKVEENKLIVRSSLRS